MPGRSAFFSTRVTPGRASKLALPPCSSLELSNAAIDAGTGRADPSARCVLECDLATHSCVLCSLVPGGPRQAALGAVITNDPAQRAWFFLKARVHPAARSHGHRIVTYRLTNQRRLSCAGTRPALLPRARPAHRGQGDTPVVGRCGAEAGAAAGRAGACPHRSSPGGACSRAAESPRWCLRHDRGAAPERRRGARLRSAVRRRLGGVHRVHAGAPGAHASEPSRAHQSSSEALEQRARRGWPPEVTARA